MEPKFKIVESFSVIGFELKTTACDGKNYSDIPKFWEETMQEHKTDAIPNKKNPDTLLGICTDCITDHGFTYIIGAEVTDTKDLPPGMVCKTIPSARYAVFTAKGKMPNSIQNTTKFIFNDWIKNSGYKLRNTPEFELYDERCDDSENCEVDIYVPIES
jgi:AraC family transcriptional regulator